MVAKKKNISFKRDRIFVALMTVCLIGIMAFNVFLMNDIASEQTEQIGQMRLQNIASGFQASLTRAEFTLTRIYSNLEEMIQSKASEEEIRSFLAEQRDIEFSLSDGNCLNVFCVIDGVVMISDMATPDDYVLQDRAWYRGLLAAGREKIYISPTYEDAFTDNMCFTIAIMLADGSTVGLDYSVAEIQAYVNEMGSEDAYGDAMIVDANEIIVGYPDPNMIGKKLSSELPQYRDVFLRAVASKDENLSLETSTNGEISTMFCSRTENGWYMMCSVSNSELYRENYRQIIFNFIIVLLVVIVMVITYFQTVRRQRAEEPAVKSRRQRRAEKQGKEKKTGVTIKDQRKFQIGITSIFIVTMVIAIMGSTTMSINESRIKMEEELRQYNYKVGDWILEQKSVLDMFNNVVAAKPEMLLDYEDMVKFLDDITKHYPKISATYIANPDFPHGHPMVMNNGWVPEPDYVEEERPWYTGALTAEDFNITEPYYDARTGEYCITFSKVVKSDGGEFYGVFAIDFYLDVLMDILGESYSEEGYAFLVDKNGLIIDHPNSDYEFSDDDSVNIHDLVYDRLYSETGMVTIKDYDGQNKVCASMDETVSGFRIIVVKEWWSIYGNVIDYSILFVGLFGVCILAVNVVINRMIKWQTRANDSLKEAAESAIQAERAKSRFLSNMSHEIRTPINAVLGMNEMILRECKDEQLLAYANNIRHSGQTLLFLINDILDMSKIESGNVEITPTSYETADVMFDLWNVIFLRAQEKGLAVEFLLDETLPRTLFGDDVRIRQIVTNLLTNAVKYTPKGGVKMYVNYQKTETDQIDLIVSVEDTGMGIRQEDMEKLFERFQRLDEKNTRNIEGTGLGLNIAMSLLKMMGGDMKIDSEYQKGSTFTVIIPQKVLNDEPTGDFGSIMGRQMSDTMQKRTSFEAPEANILVVDDNDMNLDVFKALLKRTKINIVTADSGRACLELVKQEKFHIIFMDHMMPEIDGVEALHEMQKFAGFPNENTPVIALTANALSGAREFYLGEGFVDFLTKPIDADLLEAMVISYLPKELVVTKVDEQETTADSERKDEKLTKLEQIGFNTVAGLQYCRNDIAFYEEILVKFAGDRARKAADIEDAFQGEDINRYQILVHALKSSAKTIGADELSELARVAEEAAKNQDFAYITEKHGALVARYQEVAGHISNTFCLAEEAEPDKTAKAEISKEQLLSHLTQLQACLETFEADRAEALLAEMSGFTCSHASVQELLQDIARDVEDFELGTAAEKVKEFIAKINF